LLTRTLLERKTGLEPATLTLAKAPDHRVVLQTPDFTAYFEVLRSYAVQSNPRCVGKMLEQKSKNIPSAR
jgi:hypothetical protein